MGETIIAALGNLFTIENFIFVNIGLFIGIIFGAIPGLNGNLAITVLLPFTFQMGTVPALLMLAAIFFGSNFGGSISAILINTPGTNAAAATLIDGYPMCQGGQPRRALDMALTASTVGGLISALCLLFFAPQISKVAITFGAPEYFSLAIFGLSVIASVSGKSLLKGLISGGLGILLATVGIDSVSGLSRFTFGNFRLYNGVKMLAVLLGVYAIAQMIGRINQTETVQTSELGDVAKDDHITPGDVKKTLPTMLKSSFIGAFIGAACGYFGGWVDNVVMRLFDVIASIPGMLLIMVLVMALGVGVENLIYALLISGVPGYARFVRSTVLNLTDMEYVQCAKSYGTSNFKIILRHVLPNALGPIIIMLAGSISGTILGAAGYSFMGFGVQQPTPEWGAMISASRQYMRLAIVITAMSINLVGDGLRDALDPRLKD